MPTHASAKRCAETSTNPLPGSFVYGLVNALDRDTGPGNNSSSRPTS
jgi:hypothetical protein